LSPTVLRIVCLSLVVFVAGCAIETPVEEPTEISTGWSGYSPLMPSDDETAGDTTDKVQLCVQKSTLVRAEYLPCDNDERGYKWYFMPIGKKIPAIGKKARGGSFTWPSGDLYRAPKKGGKGKAVMYVDDATRIQICVKQPSRVRVADTRCDDEDTGFGWYYLLLSRQVPAVGKKAELGSYYVSEYADTHRARRAGGKGRKVIVKDEPIEDEPEEIEDTDDCTTTINGECVATESCTRTVNSVCVEDDATTLQPPSRTCTNVYVNKRWTRRCR
jgi:hypothetical protein